MPPKRKAKEKKQNEESEKQLKNSKSKDKDESIPKLRKVSLPQTVNQKTLKDETESVGHNGRKRKTESKSEGKNCPSSLTKIKAKEDNDEKRGDKVDDSKAKSRSNKKLKLEENRDVETGRKSVHEKSGKLKEVFKEKNGSDDGSDYTQHSKRSQSKSKGRNTKKSLKPNNDVPSKRDNSGIDSGNRLQGEDFENVENACEKKRPDEFVAGDKEKESLDNEVGVMSESGSSDFEEISSQTSPSFQKSIPGSEKRGTKTKRGRPDNRKGNDDQGGDDELKVGKGRRQNVKKGIPKLKQNHTERDRKVKSVIKEENGSDYASDYTKHSKRSQSKSKGRVEKKSLKTEIKKTSFKEESSVDAGSSFQESDTDDSDLEEVENNCDEKISIELAAVDVQTKDFGKDVGLMSDSDSSDFEDVTSQKSKSSRKSRSSQQSKNQTGQTRKSKTVIKKENVSVPEKTKSVPGSRKRQSKKSAKETVIKKVKTDLIEEVPLTSASASASALYGVDEDDVTAVLLRMEGASCSQPSTSESQNYRLSEIKGSSLSDADSDEDDDAEDWEEVEDHKGSPLKSRIPTEPVEITLEAPDFMKKKRKKKKFDWLAYIQQTMRRFQKHVQINLHKVHLLCLLSHGFHQNRICNDDLLKAQAMSIIPTKWTGLESSFSKDNIRQLLKWFHDEFLLHTKSEYFSDPDSKHGLVKSEELENIISTRQIPDGRTLAIIFIVILRTLGIDVRLVMSVHPMRIKILESKKYKVKSKNGESSQVEHDQDKASKISKTSKQTKMSPKETKAVKKKNVKSEVMDDGDDDNTEYSKDRKVEPKKVKIDKGKAGKNSKAKNTSSRKSSKGKQLLQKSKPESESDSDSEEEEKPRRNLRIKERKNMAEKSEDEVSESGFDEFGPSDSESDFTDEDCKVKKRRGRQKSGGKQRKDNNTKSGGKQKGSKKKKSESKRKSTEEMSEDVIELSSDEFTEEETTFRSPLQEKLKRKNRKVLSSDSDGSESSVKSSGDIWTEVFLPGEKRWVCVDCVQNIVDKPYELESGITQPVHYVLAYTADGSVSDVTARYASQWMSQTRKLRVDQEWWTETLEPYKSQIPEHGDKDEESIKDQLMKRPLPTSIGEFKNHPLYALPRHLLKFEAIYPNTAIPFGYIRGEAIYARECVHTLHSRENWLKEGRAVRLGEEAYKMVKSRKRWRQPVKPDPNVLDLELFGYWQTEKYIPPPAVDGKITRNEYGNIELFKPWMLPAGTVHLHGFPAMNRVAKKLGLDCVPAMIDWETHGGFSHPLIDGWVVCEEHKDILIAAWDEDQEIQRQKEIAKREKRVLGNWKQLTRSLLIRERLKKKFDLKETDPEMVDVKSGEKATDTEQAWPQNREMEKKKKKLPKHVEEM